MPVVKWYSRILAGVPGVLILIQLYPLACSLYWLAKFVLLRYLAYPLAVNRQYWSSVTNLQVLLLSIYLAANGLCMGLGVKTALDLTVRSGTMTSINMVPLFFGGRTSFIADRLGVRPEDIEGY